MGRVDILALLQILKEKQLIVHDYVFVGYSFENAFENVSNKTSQIE